ncbi:MAG: S1C family serine protease [Acidimicrobiales bacterium]
MTNQSTWPYGPAGTAGGPYASTYPPLGQPAGPPPQQPTGEVGQDAPPYYQLTAHGQRRVLRSAAAALVVMAAAVAGAGVSRVIWPAAQTTSNAAGGTTPAANGGSGGTNAAPGSPQGGSGGSTYPYSPPTTSNDASGGPSDVSAIAAKVIPAVVDINVVFDYQDAEGAGTGIVLTSNGEVLTNNHVIDGATRISVTDVGNGKTYGAKVLGYDNTHDVAVLQLEGASGLQTAKLANSSKVAVGQAVVAIGNAGGVGGTPTSAGGSVLALDQSITAADQLDGTSEQLSGLIETNANIQSGDSGGPLVNVAGQVLGMDTAASTSFAFQTQGNQGFAIPINNAIAIARQVVAGKGSADVHIGPTGFLGVGVVSNPGDLSGLPNFPGFSEVPGSSSGTTYPDVPGADIENVVSGGPAATAGVTGGSVITSLDGHAVTSGMQLTHLLVPHHPGNRVELGWVSPSGQSHRAMVTLASGPPA